ncbi:hypothetical protein RHMOL_Rhmol04G0361500 [Rhododendron molle]|uniref:Uncharacterized protein n=1 Tax=Rhododendron molle TaxID=49168 RepID=A0ACC0P9M1_RHOML|nr:hypothetical protein RHMOL_Rhmol04G0361500 [Rhododendron molle]
MPKFEIGALLELIQRYRVSVACIKLVLQALNRKASAVGSPPRPSLRFLQRVVFVTSLCFQFVVVDYRDRAWIADSESIDSLSSLEIVASYSVGLDASIQLCRQIVRVINSLDCRLRVDRLAVESGNCGELRRGIGCIDNVGWRGRVIDNLEVDCEGNGQLGLPTPSRSTRCRLMASVVVAPASGLRESQMVGVDRLPEEMNDMKIRDDKEMEATVVDGNGTERGHIIVTTIGGRNGQPKQTISYMAERIVGQGSFGVVFQAKCLETGESVAIKKVLQDKRYKNRELQTMRLLDHPNVVALKHCFFSTTEKDELYLNLVLEYVPETVHRVIKHYNKLTQRMPLIYVKLYTYQIFRALSYIHGSIGVCHRDIKPQNLLVNPRTHQLKLCDFGSAKVLVKGEPNISYICSRYYRAPELIFGATEYTTAIDIWSAGCVLAELLLGQPLFPGESGVDQLVEIIKVLGTPTREEIKCVNPNYTEFKFPQIKAHPWHKIFHKRMPPEAVDLVSRLLQYSPNLRCTAATDHPQEVNAVAEVSLLGPPPGFVFIHVQRGIDTFAQKGRTDWKSLQQKAVALPETQYAFLKLALNKVEKQFVGADQAFGKLGNHFHSIGQWVRIRNVLFEVDSGLWKGFLTCASKVRLLSENDNSVAECKRNLTERLSRSGRVPMSSYHVSDFITVLTLTDYESTKFATLMDLLTFSKDKGRFKCIVRVVAICPSQIKDFWSPAGLSRIRVTLEDRTARIHTLLCGEDAVMQLYTLVMLLLGYIRVMVHYYIDLDTGMFVTNPKLMPMLLKAVRESLDEKASSL